MRNRRNLVSPLSLFQVAAPQRVNNLKRMRDILSALRPGDHAALFYRNRREQFAAVVPYIQIGLERNERCLYIAGDNSLSMVIRAMQDGGIDVATAQKEGRLTIATPEQTYLRHGIFEPERMVEGLREEIEKALADGFTAFRGTGELGWAATLPSALLRLYEYETIFDERLSPYFVALCQYDETLFSKKVISQMMRIHPKVVAREKLSENSFYLGPKETLDRYPDITVEDLMTSEVGCAA